VARFVLRQGVEGRNESSETRSREAVARLPDRLARRGLASLRFRERIWINLPAQAEERISLSIEWFFTRAYPPTAMTSGS
jgi:hypothetical protein